MPVREFLTRPKNLITLLFATVMMTGAFLLVAPHAGGWPLLDGIASAAEVRTKIASMSSSQRSTHFWMTLIIDTPYPFAYVGLFSGAILAGFRGPIGWILASPVFLLLPMDLAENTIHLIVLTVDPVALELKEMLTPAKRWLFRAAALVALIAIIFAMIRSLMNQERRT